MQNFYLQIRLQSQFIVSTLTFFFLFTVNASQIPSTPPEPCFENSCNEFMQEVVSDFYFLGRTPTLAPGVYSGTCRHLGLYSPERDHYAVVLLDQVPNNSSPPVLDTARFSTIIAFFYEENEFSKWNLNKARAEMSPYWLDKGFIKFADDTYRIEIRNDDGSPAMVYWMRQNLITNQIYYIFYSVPVMRSFCRLEKNKIQ